MLKDLIEIAKTLLKNKVIKKALRNAVIVGMYTMFSSILVLDTISLKVILISFATAGMVFSTELANYYKVALTPVQPSKLKTKNPTRNYEPFFNLW